MRRPSPVVVAALFAVVCGMTVAHPQAPEDLWLSWTAQQAEAIGKAAYVKGRAGPWFDTRLLKTDRSYNYKLAATWMTPEVIRASARLEQLAHRLDVTAARGLVEEAEATSDTIIMVEIDPREGSGVIPNDWSAFLQFDQQPPIAGRGYPAARNIKALAGVLRRNYDYDRYWLAFPLMTADGQVSIPAGVRVARLTVRVWNQEGIVTWVVPESFRTRLAALRPSTS